MIRSDETTPVAPVAETSPVPEADRPERSLSAKLAINTTLFVVGRVAVALSGLLGVGIATRYLGRPTYGQLTVSLAFVATLQALPDFGLWTVTAREITKRPHEEQRIVSNAFTLSIVFSAIAVVGGLGAMFLIYGGADDHLVREGILIAGAPLVVAAPGGIATGYMTAHQRAVPGAVGWIIASVLFLAVLLPVVAVDAGFAGVAAAFGTSALVSMLVPVYALRGRVKLRPGYDRALLRQLFVWGVPQAGVFVLQILYFRFDTLLLSVMSTDNQVALYGVAYKVVEVLPFLPLFFMSTLFPEIARTGPRSERLTMLAQWAFSAMVIVATGVVVLIGGFPGEIVTVIGGSGFHAAEPVMRYLAIATGLVFLNLVFFHSLIALNRQRQLFFAVAGTFLLNIGLNVVLIPPLGARGSALALIGSEVLLLMLVLRLYSQVGAVPRVPRPLRLLAAAGATALTVWLMHVVLGGAGPVVVLAVGGIASGAVYVAALYLLRAIPEDLREESLRLGRGLVASLRRTA